MPVNPEKSLKQVLKSRKWENLLKILISKWERQRQATGHCGQMAPELGFTGDPVCGQNVNGLDESWEGRIYDSKLTPYLHKDQKFYLLFAITAALRHF